MVRALEIKMHKSVFYFLIVIGFLGIVSFGTNLYTNQNLMGNEIYNASINSSNIEYPPAACPADSAITSFNTNFSVSTCTAYNTGLTWFNSTNVNATKYYGDWFCFTPSCNHNISYNGTDTVIQ